MDKVGSVVMAIFGGIITLAIVSAIIGQRSKAPQAIQAMGSAVANVVGKAVQPVAQTASTPNLGLNSFTSPGVSGNFGTGGAFFNPFGTGA